MRGQFLFRRCDGKVDVGIGILEAESQLVLPSDSQDLLIDCLAIRRLNHMEIKLHSQRDMPEQYPDGDIGGILTNLQYPRSNNDACGGSIFARSTRYPSPTGRRTILAAIVLEAKDKEINPRQIYGLHGKNGAYVMKPSHLAEIDPAGMALAQLHKSPIWGWEDPWGPGSTMRPDIQDECGELEDLIDAEIYNDRRTKLEQGASGSIIRVRGEPAFHAFRKAMKEAGHGHLWNRQITKDETDRRDQHAMDIIQKMQQD